MHVVLSKAKACCSVFFRLLIGRVQVELLRQPRNKDILRVQIHAAAKGLSQGSEDRRLRSPYREASSSMGKVFISGNEIFVDSYRLARKIWDDGYRPDFVLGIWRGGTPIGIAVEEFLRIQQCPIKFHTAIKTQSYTGIGQRREVEVMGLEDVVAKVNAEDKMLILDDVFDTGNSVKAVLEQFKGMARKNTPEIRTACLWYKPSANQTDIIPNYWLRETEAWLVFPHELEGLTIEEIAQKWDPEIADIIKAPGGPFAK